MSMSTVALKRYLRYVESIEQLTNGSRSSDSAAEWRLKVNRCLDGEPGTVLRREVGIHKLRQQGAFFTNSSLATKLANKLSIDTLSEQVFFDPACGAGDLLLAVAKRLPIAGTFVKTLKLWNETLSGCDISPEFVRLTKARLLLLAAKRCRAQLYDGNVDLLTTFAKIEVKNFLLQSNLVQKANTVTMNPPFGYTRAPSECVWAQGRVSAAALFIEKTIQQIRNGTRVLAVLPDVLRSGSRYQNWRNTVEDSGFVMGQRSIGLFDQWTDVDVYLFDFIKADIDQKKSSSAFVTKKTGGVGTRFAIRVGTVVPHRHIEEGKEVPYIHARSLPVWGELRRIDEKRRYTGRLFDPPFVAVRRTSRPGSGNRASATLVLGNDGVAVENHLIVMIPRDGTVDTCRALMSRLKSSKTDDWINCRMRCRHLTIPVMSEMPWWYKL